ncbi:MAG: hypothetical protein DHS20C03_18420 [Minwuia thermotolerans]|nr:MAG: hypothetical protein DHS20C03_18420 [Minwuia thermotolerans]
MDFPTLRLGRKPNQFLMAPDDLCQSAIPHAESPVFNVSAADLLRRLLDIAEGEERVSIKEVSEETLTVKLVARSKVFRFPDMIDCRILPVGSDSSTLAVYSRARYGYRDFGVNRARIAGWVRRLKQNLT